MKPMSKEERESAPKPWRDLFDKVEELERQRDELAEALNSVRDALGHTPDCPESIIQAQITRKLSTMTGPCSPFCEQVRAILERVPN